MTTPGSHSRRFLSAILGIAVACSFQHARGSSTITLSRQADVASGLVNSIPSGAGGAFSGITSTGFHTVIWLNSGSPWSLDSGGRTLTFNQLDGGLSVVPEPTTWAMLAFSLTIVMVFRRRKRS